MFTPDALMADYTVHEVVIGIVKDTAGNPLAQEQRFTFETGNTVDTVRHGITEEVFYSTSQIYSVLPSHKKRSIWGKGDSRAVVLNIY